MSQEFRAIVDPALNHVSVRVKDVAASAKFYHEVLGLPLIRRLGPEEKPRTVWFPVVELSALPEGAASAAPGFFGHIGIAVENIEEVCQRLAEKGVRFERPLSEITFEEIGQRLQLCFFRDPDGIMVELVKWRPL